jgi:hypothetical protein
MLQHKLTEKMLKLTESEPTWCQFSKQLAIHIVQLQFDTMLHLKGATQYKDGTDLIRKLYLLVVYVSIKYPLWICCCTVESLDINTIIGVLHVWQPVMAPMGCIGGDQLLEFSNAEL